MSTPYMYGCPNLGLMMVKSIIICWLFTITPVARLSLWVQNTADWQRSELLVVGHTGLTDTWFFASFCCCLDGSGCPIVESADHYCVLIVAKHTLALVLLGWFAACCPAGAVLDVHFLDQNFPKLEPQLMQLQLLSVIWVCVDLHPDLISF